MKSNCLFVSCLFGCNISVAHKQTKNPELINPLLNDMSNSLSGYSDTGYNIDGLYHRTNWSIGPKGTSKKLLGPFVTYSNTIVTGANTLAFGINKNSCSNSNVVVKYHEITYIKPFPSTGFINTLTIKLPSVIEPSNTLYFITITTTAT